MVQVAPTTSQPKWLRDHISIYMYTHG